MKLVLNESKARDCIYDSSGKLRIPMYFNNLTDSQKEVYLKILSFGKSLTVIDMFKIGSDNYDFMSFVDAVLGLIVKGYIDIKEQ